MGQRRKQVHPTRGKNKDKEMVNDVYDSMVSPSSLQGLVTSVFHKTPSPPGSSSSSMVPVNMHRQQQPSPRPSTSSAPSPPLSPHDLQRFQPLQQQQQQQQQKSTPGPSSSSMVPLNKHRQEQQRPSSPAPSPPLDLQRFQRLQQQDTPRRKKKDKRPSIFPTRDATTLAVKGRNRLLQWFAIVVRNLRAGHIPLKAQHKTWLQRHNDTLTKIVNPRLPMDERLDYLMQRSGSGTLAGVLTRILLQWQNYLQAPLLKQGNTRRHRPTTTTTMTTKPKVKAHENVMKAYQADALRRLVHLRTQRKSKKSDQQLQLPPATA
ncbi:uncharacterized protein LOC125381915 [Haliotis rufescens]|uniref:uncharacterized protein LOC125381915 n=1 Tax=Haliotis rufescens TaxID=6454 RepID=UPI00201E8E86|nr:uncharacterized protein LOC125381915 [Haliotis rufescens]